MDKRRVCWEHDVFRHGTIVIKERRVVNRHYDCQCTDMFLLTLLWYHEKSYVNSTMGSI